jgi:hypothetical protein
MRALLPLGLGLLLGGFAQAQNSVNMDAHKDSAMVQRWDSSVDKAIAAVNAGADPKASRRAKKKSELTVDFAAKTFSSSGVGGSGRKTETQSFAIGKTEASTGKFQTREFFGLKNPWFGRKVYQSETASLLGRDTAAGASKTFATDAAATRSYYQAGKSVPVSNQVVPLRSTKVEGKAQGVLDAISGQKQMTVEDVREVLNKSR